MNRHTNKIAVFFSALFIVALLSSCASSNNYKKCNGRKAIKTKMGPM